MFLARGNGSLEQLTTTNHSKLPYLFDAGVFFDPLAPLGAHMNL